MINLSLIIGLEVQNSGFRIQGPGSLWQPMSLDGNHTIAGRRGNPDAPFICPFFFILFT